MSDYRRLYLENGTYFFTVVTHERRRIFTMPENVNLLRECFRHVRKRRSFEVVSVVVLPDHLHCIWRFDGTDADYSTRWQMIKARFTRLSPELPRPIWQPRFWEHMIRDEEDLCRHLDYIHYNPVKHGYAKAPGDWRWSSFSKFVREGWYTDNWGADDDVRSIREMEFE
jgi:putative transposase